MTQITGTIPAVLFDKLLSTGVNVDGVKVAGNDIDVTLTKDDVKSTLYAIFTGNAQWVVDELDDSANIFPSVDEGDVVTLDLLAKLFINSIRSSLILSVNPLGKIKYGIKDKVDKAKKTAGKLGDKLGKAKRWFTDEISKEDATEYLRKLGRYVTTYVDPKGKTRTSVPTSDINVGFVDKLPGQPNDGGHYKVLTGCPKTQDFQVWHLYKNGKEMRVLDVKAGLENEEAQYVYDANLPYKWEESDWKDEGAEEAQDTEEADNVQEETKAEEVATEEENNVDEEVEQDNVEEQSQIQEEEQSEEENVDDVDVEVETVDEEEENVDEDPDGDELAEMMHSSVDKEKDKKKSSHNGDNVTGCVEGDGTVVMASLLLNNLVDFNNYMKTVDVKESVKPQLQQLTGWLRELLKLDPKLLNSMTRNSNDNLIVDFNEANCGMNYVLTVQIYSDRMLISGSGFDSGDQQRMFEILKTSFETVIKTLQAK